MTLLLQQNLGTAWGAPTSSFAATRRGRRQRGRARMQGYHLWWLLLVLRWWR